MKLGPKRLTALARQFAVPRRAGSGGSRKVIELLSERLAELGLEVSVETFSYDLRPVERGLRWVLVIAATTIAAAAGSLERSPWWSAVLIVGGVAAGGALLGWSPWLESLYRRPGPTRSANVVGRRRVARVGRRIILMAHHDSKSQSLPLAARMAATLGAMVGVFGIAGTTGSTLVAGEVVVPIWVVGVLGGVGAVSLLVLATMTSGNASPGGVDNAGSLAIVLAVAEDHAELSDDVELLVLFTGAEEDHMVGAMRWLDLHAGELREAPSYCLNFDGAGSPGRTVLITRFGFGRRFAPVIEGVAMAAARTLGEPVRRILMAPAVGIDAIPFAHRGLECLTLSSGSLGRATCAVHSAGDVPEHLDGPTMVRLVELARAVVTTLAGSEPMGGG